MRSREFCGNAFYFCFSLLTFYEYPMNISNLFFTPIFLAKKIAVFSFLFCICVPAFSEDWKMVFEENFDGSSVNENYWTRIDAGTPDWRKYMNAEDPSLVAFEDGCVVLKGKKDTADANVRDYREAGIYTKNKFDFQYGKVEIRAKFDNILGVWPALWMMPNTGPWPTKGEIDIMEHLNYQGNIWQTLHMGNSAGSDKSLSCQPSFDKTVFNTYGIEWRENEISFLLNGNVTKTFTKNDAENAGGIWPFDDENNEFYLILSMQIGGNWVENAGVNKGIDAATLYNSGSNMYIDYVHVWQDASMVPEPSVFGLLAGLGALALATSRRRRSRK